MLIMSVIQPHHNMHLNKVMMRANKKTKFRIKKKRIWKKLHSPSKEFSANWFATADPYGPWKERINSEKKEKKKKERKTFFW